MELTAPGDPRHFPDRTRQPAGSVVRDAAVQPGVTRFEKKIGHLLLRYRVANLHRGDRRFLVEFRGRKCGPVDAVFSDSSASHHDEVASVRSLDGRVHVADLLRENAARAAEDERFTRVPVIENDGSVHRRNAALVPAMLDTSAHSVEHPLWMKKPRRKLFVVIGRGKTEDVRVEDELGSDACARGVSIDADDSGQRPAIGVEGGWAVVRLDLTDKIPVVVELDNPRVIVKNGDKPVHLPADFFCCSFDARVKKAVNDLGFPVLRIGDLPAEDFVFAVFGPCLGNCLQLRVCRFRLEAETPAFLDDLRPPVICLNGFHLLQVKGEDAFRAYPQQFLIRDIQVVVAHEGLVSAFHFGNIEPRRIVRVPLVLAGDFPPLNQFIGQQTGGDSLRVLA